MALEAERFDLSYRSAKSNDLSVTEVKPKRRKTDTKISTQPPRPTIQEIRERTERDQLLYNAGRYAGGARDQDAVQAFMTLNKGRK